MPELENDASPYANIVKYYRMGFAERLVLMLALVPHVRPQLLDVFFSKNETYGRGYTEFGGLKGNHHSGFLPTGETAIFLLAGMDVAQRFEYAELLTSNHYFYKFNILKVQTIDAPNEPQWSGALTISREYLSLLTTGREYKPDFSPGFPARLITTKLTWNDLVIEDEVLEEIEKMAYFPLPC